MITEKFISLPLSDGTRKLISAKAVVGVSQFIVVGAPTDPSTITNIFYQDGLAVKLTHNAVAPPEVSNLIIDLLAKGMRVTGNKPVYEVSQLELGDIQVSAVECFNPQRGSVQVVTSDTTVPTNFTDGTIYVQAGNNINFTLPDSFQGFGEYFVGKRITFIVTDDTSSVNVFVGGSLQTIRGNLNTPSGLNHIGGGVTGIQRRTSGSPEDGDFVTLVCTDSNRWDIVGSAGEWFQISI